MSVPRIRIVADGGQGYGFGHISRSLTLASEMQSRDFAVHLDILSADARKTTDSPPGCEGPFDATIIDLPYDGDSWTKEARQSGQIVLGMDYLGLASPDIVVRLNQALKPVPCGRFVQGLDYAVVRQPVREAEAALAGHVLVVIGASDLGDAGPVAAEKIDNTGSKVILVRGPMSKNRDWADVPYRVCRTPDDLPALMAGCTWAVSNAGTTLVELMSLGKAVHVLPQTPEEDCFARGLAADGLLLGFGMQALSLPDMPDLERVAAAAGARVDGGGARRIVDMLADALDRRAGAT